MSKKRTGTLFIRSLDLKIKNKFKAWCADQNVTMKEAIQKLMSEVVEKSMIEKIENLMDEKYN